VPVSCTDPRARFRPGSSAPSAIPAPIAPRIQTGNRRSSRESRATTASLPGTLRSIALPGALSVSIATVKVLHRYL